MRPTGSEYEWFILLSQMQIYLSFLWFKTHVWISSWQSLLCPEITLVLVWVFQFIFLRNAALQKLYPVLSFAKHSKFEFWEYFSLTLFPCYHVFVCYFKIFKCFSENFEYKRKPGYIKYYLVLKKINELNSFLRY